MVVNICSSYLKKKEKKVNFMLCIFCHNKKQENVMAPQLAPDHPGTWPADTHCCSPVSATRALLLTPQKPFLPLCPAEQTFPNTHPPLYPHEPNSKLYGCCLIQQGPNFTWELGPQVKLSIIKIILEKSLTPSLSSTHQLSL